MKLKNAQITKYKCVEDSTLGKSIRSPRLSEKMRPENPQYLRRYISSILWKKTHRIFIRMTIRAGMH